MSDVQFPGSICRRACPDVLSTSGRDLPRREEQSFLTRSSKMSSKVSCKCLNRLVNEETITGSQLAGCRRPVPV